MYAIVLAGGVGSRLWPRSRNNTPKQLIDLIPGDSMLQESVKRLSCLMPQENVVIVTGENLAAETRRQLPELPAENVIVEPAGRGTAPAIGLGLLHVARLAEARGDKDPVVGSFTADHIIANVDQFCKVVAVAGQVAAENYIVTLGITPDSPHTGYGYIEQGEKLEEIEEVPVFKVARFVEKPPRVKAEEYLATGRYCWNSGMFIWRLSMIMGEYRTYLPELSRQLEQINEVYGKPEEAEVVAKVWSEVRTETIDVGIAEKSQRMAVLPADIGWSDVGDWSAVAELIASMDKSEEGNAIVGQHIGMGTKNSLIYSTSPSKLVATIGLEDVVVVDTHDVLLVARRSQNQDVKKVVERLKQEGLDKYL
jgi:mannose-1-phosphate guanylyltransferase